jgi:hypothetical protein
MASLTPAARTVLARLELIQHGTTTSYNPAKGSRNSEDPASPPGESDPPHLRWRAAMDACEDAALPIVIDRALVELEHCLHRPLAPVRGETMGELKGRVIAASGHPARDVAYALRCTERLVRTTRAEAGQDMDNGRPLPASEPTDRVGHARELVAGGLTMRQTAAVLGVAHTTVSRWFEGATPRA